MKKLHLAIGIVLASTLTAITYHVFENLVHESISLVWYDLFDTDARRWLVVPLALGLGLLFFGFQHLLDPKSEVQEEEGLNGPLPKASLKQFGVVLFLGYWSLLAGASLGPEAILVPATMLIGVIVAKRILRASREITELIAAMAMVALFTAFFHSIIVGVLSIALVSSRIKQTKLLLLVSGVASAGIAYGVLEVVEGKSYLELPAYGWALNPTTILATSIMVALGYGAITGMASAHSILHRVRSTSMLRHWAPRSVVAAIGIAGLYLLGGPLVEFTGNLSIEALFQQAAELGLAGLSVILIVKILLIAWSKAIGYRGGMIFPTVFVLCVLIAMVHLYLPEANYIYGLIGGFVGAFLANRRSHILV